MKQSDVGVCGTCGAEFESHVSDDIVYGRHRVCAYGEETASKVGKMPDDLPSLFL